MTTLVTAAQIAEVRRMVNEPTVTPYSDALITSFLERYPLMDELGEEPYYYTQTTTVPTKTVNTEWIPTYDLHAAAADIWTEKAAALSIKYNYSADGGNYSVSQAYQQAMAMAQTYRAMRALKTTKMVKTPDEPEGERPSWIGNLPEPPDFGGGYGSD